MSKTITAWIADAREVFNRCRVCRGIHPLRKCQRFLKLSAENRLRAVFINKYCANCLAHKHSTWSCRSGDRCRTCDRNHHTLLHMHELVSRKKSGFQQQPASPRRRYPATPRRTEAIILSVKHFSLSIKPKNKYENYLHSSYKREKHFNFFCSKIYVKF